MSDMTSITKR